MKRKPRFGEKWAALSAIALLCFLLFVDWFGPGEIEGAYFDGSAGGATYSFGEGVSGWDSLGWLALALCVLAVVAGLACAAAFSLYESPVLPVAAAIAATTFGLLAVVALLVQVVSQPGPDEVVTVQAGWWLGLLSAAGVARGGFLSMRDEYLPGAPMPDVEVRPAPAA